MLSGRATYDGFLTVAEYHPDATRFAALGEASVTVDFDSGVRTGSATHFYVSDLDTLDFADENQDLSTVETSAIDGETATYDLGVQNFEIGDVSGAYLLVASEGTSAAVGCGDLKTDGTFIGVDTTN